MNLRSVKIDSVLVVEVGCKHIDANNSDDFKKETLSLLSPVRDTLLDLAELNFIDSSGLGALLACMRRVRAGGGRLMLCNLRPTVQSIAEMVHLKRVIEIERTRELALEALRHTA